MAFPVKNSGANNADLLLTTTQKPRSEIDWLTNNRAAISTYNERVEREGLFGEEHRRF